MHRYGHRCAHMCEGQPQLSFSGAVLFFETGSLIETWNSPSRPSSLTGTTSDFSDSTSPPQLYHTQFVAVVLSLNIISGVKLRYFTNQPIFLTH